MKTEVDLLRPDPTPSSRSLVGLITTTDHKVIGLAYIVTAIVFLLTYFAVAYLYRRFIGGHGSRQDS